MIDVIEYYSKPSKTYRSEYAPGQFFWAPIPFIPDVSPKRLRLDYLDPDKSSNTSFTLERTDFKHQAYEQDQPLRHLGLSRDDVLIANPFKKRPVIILSDNLRRPDDIVQQYSGYMVVPCYSLHDESGNYKRWLNRDVILRAKGYQYPNIFYLPTSSELDIPESFARLDRVQFVRIEHLEHRPCILTSDAIGLLREWFFHYLGCPLLNPALEEYIKITSIKLSSILSD